LNSYENARRAIEFARPERLPVYFGSLKMNDFHHVKWNQIGVGDKTLPTSFDEWGCGWVRSEVANMGQVKFHPLADRNALADYRWPDPFNPAFYWGMEDRFKGCDGKYVTTGIFMLLFERMQALIGLENTLTGLYLEREWIEDLADRIVEFDLGIIQNILQRFPREIHAFSFTEDWGTQQALMINPRLWDEFFKPRYKRIFDTIHAAGWHVWMHSCGKINAILDGLIEIGTDIIELQQPRTVGIEAIGQKFRGRICFASLCDIQHTLPFKNDDEIRAEAQLLLDQWATPEGGFILIDYGDGNAIGVSLEKKQVMLDAFLKSDPWKQRLNPLSAK
jgi:uroporphyrinogen decarboxylase